MAYHLDGTFRELLRYHLKVHPSGLNATVFHLYHCALLGKIPPIET